jgi:hypothetical protein
VVAQCDSEYRVSVAAEMDMYPKFAPWVFVEPRLAERRRMGGYVPTCIGTLDRTIKNRQGFVRLSKSASRYMPKCRTSSRHAQKSCLPLSCGYYRNFTMTSLAWPISSNRILDAYPTPCNRVRRTTLSVPTAPSQDWAELSKSSGLGFFECAPMKVIFVSRRLKSRPLLREMR